MTNEPQAVELPFQAEVQKVLSLVIHSLYTHPEVFLRELVSNASDALDKARFFALTHADAQPQQGEPRIEIRLDEDARTLTICDNGIGMTREEVEKNLGTIAKSGTLEFLAALKDKKKEDAPSLIGQFGVGFYASFMVASRVDVKTRSMTPGAEPVVWRSSGEGTFTLAPGDRETPGTEIVLHLKDEHREFARPWRVKEIITKYSDFVHFPIHVGGEQANRSAALWTLPRAQVTAEQHAELYRHVSAGHLGEEPLLTIHWSVDAPIQFHGLLYVPSRAPLDLFAQSARANLRLYAKRVLIQEHCEKIAPVYLRFLRGVVDSEDLSLNVSREMLQEDKALQQIEQAVVRQTLKALKELAESDDAKYQTFWRELGRVLKEGVVLDWKHKDAIAELCRFESLKGAAGALTSLAAYVAAMPEDQKEIWYVTGASRAAVERSPHLEAFKKRGWDVLFFVDPVDEWVAQSLTEFGGKKLRSVAHGDVDLGDAPKDESALTHAVASVKAALADKVKDVRLSHRLTESASCLVAADGDPSAHLERILRAMDKESPHKKRILELNPDHAIVRNLETLAERSPNDPRVGQWSELLLDQALLAEGIVDDPAQLVRKLQDLLSQVSSQAVAR